MLRFVQLSESKGNQAVMGKERSQLDSELSREVARNQQLQLQFNAQSGVSSARSTHGLLHPLFLVAVLQPRCCV